MPEQPTDRQERTESLLGQHRRFMAAPGMTPADLAVGIGGGLCIAALLWVLLPLPWAVCLVAGVALGLICADRDNYPAPPSPGDREE